MKENLHIDNISLDDFKLHLDRYPACVDETLQKLDDERLRTIPELLLERGKTEPLYFEKSEIETLVDWKLSHGTFRPALKARVKSNDPTFIHATTREAFSVLQSSPPAAGGDDVTFSNEQVLKALNILTRLNGIGPATASLLLSSAYPKHIPFFSDEFYRWSVFGDAGGSTKKGGWERKIGYTVKEYGGLLDAVRLLRERLGVDARDGECVAYVLARKGDDVEDEDGSMEKGAKGDGGMEKDSKKDVDGSVKNGKKRKDGKRKTSDSSAEEEKDTKRKRQK